jgi:murein DD-endopeptidase MepM/ murein hydrolase activator NlpD
VAAALIASPEQAVMPHTAPLRREETVALDGTGPIIGKPLSERAFVHSEEPDTGAREALEPSEADHDLRLSLLVEPKRPISLPSRHAWSPIPSATFASLSRDGRSLLPGASAWQLLDALRPGREPAVAAVPEFIMPFERGRVTSLFNQGRRHPAIDLAGPLGTPVHATTRVQTVTFAGWRGGYGNLVVTRDPLGRQHYYGHLQRITARVGDVLDQGETLGLLGSTGRSTGPHVHYEVRTPGGRHLDPVGLLFPGLTVARGYAWNGARSVRFAARTDARTDQPRPR